MNSGGRKRLCGPVVSPPAGAGGSGAAQSLAAPD